MSAAPAKTADPSMEEILASIRRIIADDEDKAPEPQAPEVASEAPNVPHDVEEEEDVLDLSTSDLTAAPDTSLDIELPELSFQAAPVPEEASAPKPTLVPLPEPVPVVAPNPVMDAPAPRAPQPEKPRLAEVPPPAPQPALAPADAAAPSAPTPSVSETIVSHATTASVGQAFNLLSHTIMSQTPNTLEDIVREMLRPMLKTWLDDNLPPLVERLVAAEIQRVARGQR